MKDTIYREDAIKAVCQGCLEDYGECQHHWFCPMLTKLSKVEAAPSANRPQGEWIAKDGVFYCSCCGNDSAELSEDDVYVYKVPLPNYCKDCGARMKRASNE